jgi:ficolin
MAKYGLLLLCIGIIHLQKIDGTVGISWSSEGQNAFRLFGKPTTDADISACKKSCEDDADCTGVDWNECASAGSQCELSGPWSGKVSKDGLKHYELKRDCSREAIVLKPVDCAEIKLLRRNAEDGIYRVYVGGDQRPMDVYCDMTTDGGGWTLFQRRKDGSENFYRGWDDYAAGFGDLSGEFWLGNDKIYELMNVSRTDIQLRVDMTDYDGNKAYAKYGNFKLGTAAQKYKLASLGDYSGTAGDSLTYSVGQNFGTNDQDNDPHASHNCAVKFKGAWWYKTCHESNLNGQYLRGDHESFADGVNWKAFKGYHHSLRFTEMKVRP